MSWFLFFNDYLESLELQDLRDLSLDYLNSLLLDLDFDFDLDLFFLVRD